MKPKETGYLYDKIALWWSAQAGDSTTGLGFVSRAIGLAAIRGKALDVGCGCGGSKVNTLLENGFQVVGLDVSKSMIDLARKRHSNSDFIFADICEWEPEEKYDAIIAWDSIFHVPYASQAGVIRKLCGALASQGVILFTAGGIDNEITGEMCGEDFYYSSLTEEAYLRLLKEMDCKCILLERDQYPEEHVVFIGVKSSAITRKNA